MKFYAANFMLTSHRKQVFEVLFPDNLNQFIQINPN